MRHIIISDVKGCDRIDLIVDRAKPDDCNVSISSNGTKLEGRTPVFTLYRALAGILIELAGEPIKRCQICGHAINSQGCTNDTCITHVGEQ